MLQELISHPPSPLRSSHDVRTSHWEQTEASDPTDDRMEPQTFFMGKLSFTTAPVLLSKAQDSVQRRHTGTERPLFLQGSIPS